MDDTVTSPDGIKALQEQLKALNFKVDVNGQIDRKTQIAFRAFMWDLQAVAAKNGQRDAAVDGIYDSSTSSAVSSGPPAGFKIPSPEDDTRFHRRAERAGKTDSEYALDLYKAASAMGLGTLDAPQLQELRVGLPTAERDVTADQKQIRVAGAVVDPDGGPKAGRQDQNSPPGAPASKSISIRTVLGALQRQEVKDDRNKDSVPDARKHWYLPGDSEAARFKSVLLTEPFNGHADRKIKLNYFDIKDELTRLNKQYDLQASPKEIEDATTSIMATYGAKSPGLFATSTATLPPATSAPAIVSGQSPAATKGAPVKSEYISIRKILGALQREEVKDDRNKDSVPDARKHWYLPGDSEAARFKSVLLTEPFNGHADRKIKLNYFDIKDELTKLNKQYDLQASPKEIEDATRSIMATYGARPGVLAAGLPGIVPDGPKWPG